MPKCIVCNQESTHSICPICADKLLDNMPLHDQLAHALVGIDALAGLPNLNQRLKEKIIQFAANNPCLTRSRIAEHYGISRERVRQILKRANVNTRHIVQPKKRYCKCGNEITEKGVQYCYQCRHIELVCDNCGKHFTRSITAVSSKHMEHNHAFCSKYCQGQYMGEHYGFSVNVVHGRASKYTPILPMFFDSINKSNKSISSISRQFNIPTQTGCWLVKRYGVKRQINNEGG